MDSVVLVGFLFVEHLHLVGKRNIAERTEFELC